ncbi:uncharacterized protein [Prorops nasuta]|uniref:uncharacterized protein n=1 Tax=Prorops nasuta TaxID=863751 RepID=UPI0034CE2317
MQRVPVLLAPSHHSKIWTNYALRVYLSCREFPPPGKDYLALTPQARSKFAFSQNLCINCLRPGHSCSNCSSSSRCRKCSKMHHTLLHFDKSGTGGSKSRGTTPAANSASEPEPSSSHSTTHLSVTDTRSVLLDTFSARIDAPDGSRIIVRGLFDTGSETSFISENLAQQLRIPRKRINATIHGVALTSAQNVRAEAQITLHSLSRHGVSLDVTAIILPMITQYLPPTYSRSSFPSLSGIDFADNFASTKVPIDVLIGADYLTSVVEGPYINSSDNSLRAQRTIFGWIVAGVVPKAGHSHSLTVHHCFDLENTLRDFWELEEVPEVKPMSTEDSLCEQHFVDTVTRTPSGRFVVALPFRSDIEKHSLGSSSRVAEKTLSRILRRLETSPDQAESYSQFLQEYIMLGHMSPVPMNSDFRVFLPHHAVFKTENQKTKIRVVFNASSKTSTGVSLNDTLFIGPKIQQDITRILMNWRAFRYVGVTDIVKMFRQILAFELNTVTYGTGPAPFLSSRVLREFASTDGANFPFAQDVLLNSTYVDDILFGAHDVKQLSSVRVQIIALLAKGGFSLSKWAFNQPGKVLGIYWDHGDDSFRFRVSPSSIGVLTKRILLSENAKIFDPLGWISPLVITLKQLMQSTWLLKLSWDEEIPEPVQSKWLKCYEQLRDLQSLRIPRWTGQTPNTRKRELIGFCDASELPALLVKLLVHVKGSLVGSCDAIRCYSDSQVALAWIAKQPVHWKTGTSAQQLSEDSLWWHGPAFLREHTANLVQVFETAEESRKVALTAQLSTTQCWFFDKFSSWSKLVRVMAYVLRFVQRTRKTGQWEDSLLSTSEIRESIIAIVQVVQRTHFADELSALNHGSRIPSRSKLLSLYPVIDSQGILRIGGRLRNAEISEQMKHPIILPNCHLTAILIRQTHLDTLHGGLQLTLSTLRQKFWVINARNLVKSCVHKCITCVRERAKLGSQLMGSLPAARVSRSLTFEHTGVDYAGPFIVKLHHGRNAKSIKCYVAVFVCLSTRAVHLELVSRLDTEAFLAALSRFISRRGKPAVMYSDNGLNFQGADAELKRAYQCSLEAARSQKTDSLSEIEWKFIPVATPHWGGLWESAVKSMKHHLKRSIGVLVPNFEEMTTLLTKIEACLNSRPISRLHDDPESLDVLTPGHFLSGRALNSPPELSTLDLRQSSLNRWQTVNRITETFWKKWSSEYLHTLQHRPKWQISNSEFGEGDLVLVKVPNNPPRMWTLGRILQLVPGVDGPSLWVVSGSIFTLLSGILGLFRLPYFLRKLPGALQVAYSLPGFLGLSRLPPPLSGVLGLFRSPSFLFQTFWNTSDIRHVFSSKSPTILTESSYSSFVLFGAAILSMADYSWAHLLGVGYEDEGDDVLELHAPREETEFRRLFGHVLPAGQKEKPAPPPPPPPAPRPRARRQKPVIASKKSIASANWAGKVLDDPSARELERNAQKIRVRAFGQEIEVPLYTALKLRRWKAWAPQGKITLRWSPSLELHSAKLHMKLKT